MAVLHKFEATIAEIKLNQLNCVESYKLKTRISNAPNILQVLSK